MIGSPLKWFRNPVAGHTWLWEGRSVDLKPKLSEDERTARGTVEDAADERAEQMTTDPSKALLRWIAKLGAGVVTALGLTGLMGLIGSAVLYQRFNEAGLPATQALAVVPDDQRVIEGVSQVAAALAIGAIAVAVLFSLDRTGRINFWSDLALLLLLGAGIFYAVDADLPSEQVWLLGGLAVVLVGVSVGVGKVTGDRFVPFALAVFISTVVFAGAVEYAKAADENLIPPAAVLRSPGGEGIRGLYVADTEDFVYIAMIRGGFKPERGIEPRYPAASFLCIAFHERTSLGC
jgi:hypothetical protein